MLRRLFSIWNVKYTYTRYAYVLCYSYRSVTNRNHSEITERNKIHQPGCVVCFVAFFSGGWWMGSFVRACVRLLQVCVVFKSYVCGLICLEPNGPRVVFGEAHRTNFLVWVQYNRVVFKEVYLG